MMEKVDLFITSKITSSFSYIYKEDREDFDI